MSKYLTLGGTLRIIHKITLDTPEDFQATYQGFQINITEMARVGQDQRPRNSLEVPGRDGCLIVDTWEYADEVDRNALLVKAIENILSCL